MAYADVSDLENRWRELSTDEQARAAVLLDDASVILAALVNVDKTNEQQANVLKIVSCNMVKRAMSCNDVDGISNASQTIGSTSVALTWVNPDGALYLTKNDKAMLGISASGKYRSIQAHTYADDLGDAV